jgi:hypothetical protein
MPLYNPPLQSQQVYTLSTVTLTRTYDPTTAIPATTNQVLATLLTDLKAATVVK